MNEDVIRIANLTKFYNQKKVLDNVTLNIEKGKIYGFIGQNGAGKTTLIRILLGLSFADHGVLEICSQFHDPRLDRRHLATHCINV